MQILLMAAMVCICVVNFKIVSSKQIEVIELNRTINSIMKTNEELLSLNNKFKHEINGLKDSINNGAMLVEQLNKKIEESEDRYIMLTNSFNVTKDKKEKASILISKLKKELKEEQKKKCRVEGKYFYMKEMFEPLMKKNRSLELIIDSYRKGVGSIDKYEELKRS